MHAHTHMQTHKIHRHIHTHIWFSAFHFFGVSYSTNLIMWGDWEEAKLEEWWYHIRLINCALGDTGFSTLCFGDSRQKGKFAAHGCNYRQWLLLETIQCCVMNIGAMYLLCLQAMAEGQVPCRMSCTTNCSWTCHIMWTQSLCLNELKQQWC